MNDCIPTLSVAAVFRCEVLTQPDNGVLTFSRDNLLNSRAEYGCVSGFELDGNQVRTCTLDGWTGSEPVCRGMCNSIALAPVS